MRFNRNVSPELQEVLLEQLEKYKKEMKMNRKELSELHKWVAQGNGPYENGDYYYSEDGYPMDFVNALRFGEELVEMKEIYITETDDIGFVPQDDSEKQPASYVADEEPPF